MCDSLADREDDDDACCDTKAYTHHTSGSPSSNVISIGILLARSRIQESICVESLGGMRDICYAEIPSQQDDQPEQVHKRRRVDPRDDELEQAKDGIQAMLRDVDPERILGRIRFRVQQSPIHDGDDKGKRHNGGKEQVMQRLQDPREAIEERGASVKGIRKGMDGRDGKVEGDAPKAQDGEV